MPSIEKNAGLTVDVLGSYGIVMVSTRCWQWAARSGFALSSGCSTYGHMDVDGVIRWRVLGGLVNGDPLFISYWYYRTTLLARRESRGFVTMFALARS